MPNITTVCFISWNQEVLGLYWNHTKFIRPHIKEIKLIRLALFPCSRSHWRCRHYGNEYIIGSHILSYRNTYLLRPQNQPKIFLHIQSAQRFTCKFITNFHLHESSAKGFMLTTLFLLQEADEQDGPERCVEIIIWMEGTNLRLESFKVRECQLNNK